MTGVDIAQSVVIFVLAAAVITQNGTITKINETVRILVGRK